MYARVARLDTTCCPNGATDCPGGQPTACSVACGAALSPLMDECGAMLDVLFDAADGVEDGTADIFRSLLRMCNLLMPQEILGELQPLQAAGRCPDEWTEGVGATAVSAAACSDARPNCAALTQLMTCAGDFCNTPGAACVMTGQCDKTCGFCPEVTDSDDDGHRRRQRRLQVQAGVEHACSPDIFSAGAAAVTAACCDTATEGCDGVPAECDARCGIVFVDFYGRCAELLRVYEPEHMAEYDRLEATCAEELPVAPLLQLLSQCSDPASICSTVDCGEHGTCTTVDTPPPPGSPATSIPTATCECEEGWQGEACEIPSDPCMYPALVDCGDHRTCNDGVCTCSAAYSGDVCEVAPLPCCRSDGRGPDSAYGSCRRKCGQHCT